MQESLTTLQAAQAAVTNVKTFTLGSTEHAAEKAKFAQLYSTKIKQCFADLDVRFLLSILQYFAHFRLQIAGEFDEWNNAFISGMTTDEDHFRRMQQRLGITT